MLFQLNQSKRVKLVETATRRRSCRVSWPTPAGSTLRFTYVGVRNRQGTVVVASDKLLPVREPRKTRRHRANVGFRRPNLAAQERMKKLAASARLIEPGHDPAVFAKYQAGTGRRG
jgi:hypothetical protein